METNPIRKKFK